MEDAQNEMGVFWYVSSRPPPCPYLVRLLGIYRDATHTWLESEFVSGGELFEALTAAAPGTWTEQRVCRTIWQLLQALRYLAHHNIGHRDVSLENMLVQGDIIKLMDFGQAVQLAVLDSKGARIELRYFRPAGKQYYRPPEAYVPTQTTIQAICPAGYQPGDIVMVQVGGYLIEVQFENPTPSSPSSATPMGYRVGPMDMFAVGVCIFVLHTCNPPWRMAMRNDQLFHYIQTQGLRKLWAAWRKPMLPDAAMQLAEALIQADPTNRPTLEQALANEWFGSMGEGTPLPDPIPLPVSSASAPSPSAVPASSTSSSSTAAPHPPLAANSTSGYVETETRYIKAQGEAMTRSALANLIDRVEASRTEEQRAATVEELWNAATPLAAVSASSSSGGAAASSAAADTSTAASSSSSAAAAAATPGSSPGTGP